MPVSWTDTREKSQFSGYISCKQAQSGISHRAVIYTPSIQHVVQQQQQQQPRQLASYTIFIFINHPDVVVHILRQVLSSAITQQDRQLRRCRLREM